MKSKKSKNGFTIVEVIFVFMLILGVAFFVVPKSLENTKQAKFISKWVQKYSQCQYMFTVMKAQQDNSIKLELEKAKNIEEKNEIFLNSVKPYLRLKSRVENYSQKFMNGSEIAKDSQFYSKKFFFNQYDEIISLKWLTPTSCEKKDELCAILSFDLNGLEEPNRWGYDIFGLNVYKNKIEPLGFGLPQSILKNDCSKNGFGVYCSYYYIVGGKFE